jgi:hypothetical protein
MVSPIKPFEPIYHKGYAIWHLIIKSPYPFLPSPSQKWWIKKDETPKIKNSQEVCNEGYYSRPHGDP